MNTILLSTVVPALRAALETRPPLLQKGSVLLACVSGGGDSVALLRGLAILRETSGFSLFVVHVDHGLRGEASHGDSLFVKDLCKELNIPLQIFERDVAASLAAHPGSLETRARDIRYACFQQAYEQVKADALITAHHRDDQAETVLMHLMRGAGIQGLCGIRVDSYRQGMRILRPLMTVPKKNLLAALTEQGFPWREDATNQVPDTLRNKLRLTYLPMMEEDFPAAAEALSRTAEVCALDEDYWALEVGKLLKTPGAFYPGYRCISLDAITSCHPALLGRVLRTLWQLAGPKALREQGLSLQQTQDFIALAKGASGQTINLPKGYQGHRGYRCIHLVPEKNTSNQAPLSFFPEETVAYGEGSLHWKPAPSNDTGDGKVRQRMPMSLLAKAEVRTRMPGDWIIPFGQSGRQSLQDYFINRKVDRPFRDQIPLVTIESQVLWIPGVGAANPCALTCQDTPAALLWVDGSLPWMMPIISKA